MKKPVLLLSFIICLFTYSGAQTNILLTNSEADQVMKGQYAPENYYTPTTPSAIEEMICGINDGVSADTLHHYLEVLASFHNRNTFADTVSNSTGAGAARRWIHKKFEEFSIRNENKLIPSYMQFDMPTGYCGPTQLRNILAVLPGTDTSDKSIILIEGHMDSRCEDVCDTTCRAHGVDDNGSGTALVIELARVMSRYQFSQTIVFMATVGEEQGLYGATAFAMHAMNKGIQIRSVQNNDIVSGIICGERASPPGCPGLNDIDSRHVRIYSRGPMYNSPHRAYGRWVKLNYETNVLPVVEVPMEIMIINQRDRTGRGGDHMPFDERGYTAVRFTSANEHGDGGPDSSYSDRQHTVDDILGADTDNDGEIDSFFVDFNYLARNTVINGTSAGMASAASEKPQLYLTNNSSGIKAEVYDPLFLDSYVLGVRTSTNDFDAVYEFNKWPFTIPDIDSGTTYFISLAGKDKQGITTFFTDEEIVKAKATIPSSDSNLISSNAINCEKVWINDKETHAATVTMQPASPNPFDEVTTITIICQDKVNYKNASLVISDIMGRKIKTIPFQLDQKVNEVDYFHGYNTTGIYYYSLVIDGKIWQTGKMLFTR